MRKDEQCVQDLVQDHFSEQSVDVCQGTRHVEARKELTATAAEMERTARKAVINLVEVSQPVDLPRLLEHLVVEECVALFNSNGTRRKTQKSKLTQKPSLQYIDLQVRHMSIATPTAEDRQTQDGTPYKWSDYVHKVSSVILARHGHADRIMCVYMHMYMCIFD